MSLRALTTPPPTRHSCVLCGIVLAGGDGVRLRPFVRRLTGEEIPKQFVSFVGGRSMLECTLARVQRLIPPGRTFVVVGEPHLSHARVRRQLDGRPPGTVVVQPANRDTGAGVLLPLAHVHRRHPDAVVAVFPSDHFIVEEERFMAHVERACGVVERDPSVLVLLGVEAQRPEAEYGYILPTREPGASGELGVAGFVEKPSAGAAAGLARRGALWNTLVMALRPAALFDLVRRTAPALHASFQRILEAVGTPHEADVVREIYADLPAFNLSRQLLEPAAAERPSRLRAMPVQGVQWSDWGSEERVLASLRELQPTEERFAALA